MADLNFVETELFGEKVVVREDRSVDVTEPMYFDDRGYTAVPPKPGIPQALQVLYGKPVSHETDLTP